MHLHLQIPICCVMLRYNYADFCVAKHLSEMIKIYTFVMIRYNNDVIVIRLH
jgi:hypothetical protein